ncbi:hypothetical protein ATANTOWER_003780 [Ataeniobius toweri]|uniref:Uncharacterized protein n=1 Tax=Ataeniobius toweri TaxID=208326 RepID=A0ABU7C6D4_9TELE|nr:hypothetical protein [Ataeniobius toweri]
MCSNYMTTPQKATSFYFTDLVTVVTTPTLLCKRLFGEVLNVFIINKEFNIKSRDAEINRRLPGKRIFYDRLMLPLHIQDMTVEHSAPMYSTTRERIFGKKN